ncbi:MAG: 2OG-Fe(II) oxygenase [Kofleriaceae bacterium]
MRFAIHGAADRGIARDGVIEPASPAPLGGAVLHDASVRDILRLGPWAVDVDALVCAWRSAAPFPHVVIDGFLAPDCLDDVLAILDEEGLTRYEADLYAFDATAPEPRTSEMRALRAEWADKLAPILSRITGSSVATADLRAYAYRVGDYLLPHADHQEGLERRLAFAYYLPTPSDDAGDEAGAAHDADAIGAPDAHMAVAAGPRESARSLVGGELELYRCRVTNGELADIESAKLIEARANRIAIFDVSDISLHQVREVLGGLRLSLSGWFYP